MNRTVIILLLIFVAACSKDPATTSDTTAPVIALNSPSANQVYTAGQPINISGSITDNNYIAEVHIHVSNTNTGALLMDVHLYPAGSTATFNQSLTAVAGVNYKIQVIAKDKAVNEGRSTVDASCN
jgi:Bacterial Ig domain